MSSIDELHKLLDEILKSGVSITTYFDVGYGRYMWTLDDGGAPAYRVQFAISNAELIQVRDPHYVVYLHLRQAYRQITDARKKRNEAH